MALIYHYKNASYKFQGFIVKGDSDTHTHTPHTQKWLLAPEDG